MKATVVIAAGGEGRRLRRRTPKAFLPVGGVPLFLHSVRTYASVPAVTEIILVLPEEWIDRTVRRYGHELGRLKVAAIVPGGTRRQDSVWNGLRCASAGLVLIHDAARPFVTREVIRRAMKAADRHGAVVAAVPALDTVKIVDARGRVCATPDRRRVHLAQTPQAFRRTVLVRAYQRAGRRDATDDAQIVERAGGSVFVVDGDRSNFKVTTPEDLRRARARWNSRENS